MKLSAWRQDVDIEDALCLLAQLIAAGHDKTRIWTMLEPYLARGSELKAKYAYEDLWGVCGD